MNPIAQEMVIDVNQDDEVLFEELLRTHLETEEDISSTSPAANHQLADNNSNAVLEDEDGSVEEFIQAVYLELEDGFSSNIPAANHQLADDNNNVVLQDLSPEELEAYFEAEEERISSNIPAANYQVADDSYNMDVDVNLDYYEDWIDEEEEEEELGGNIPSAIHYNDDDQRRREDEELMAARHLGYREYMSRTIQLRFPSAIESDVKIAISNPSRLREMAERILRELDRVEEVVHEDVTFRRSREEDVEGGICVVCQCGYELRQDVGKLECGHEYHSGCIKRWLHVDNSCPLCKRKAISTLICSFQFDSSNMRISER